MKTVKRQFPFTDSPQKQIIREKLWEHTLKKVQERIKKIDYLTLPGPACIELKKFSDLGLITRDRTVSVERNRQYYDQIVTFYAKWGELTTKPFTHLIHQGEIQNLMRKKSFTERFPFHVINLDLYGSPLELEANEESSIFNLIEDIISVQKIAKRELYLMPTVKVSNSTLSKSRTKKQVDASEILKPFFELTKNEELRRVLEEKKADPTIADLLTIYAIILQILDQPGRDVTVELVLPPYTYVGDGKVMRMLSCVFKVTYQAIRQLKPKSYHDELKKTKMNEAIALIKQQVKLN